MDLTGGVDCVASSGPLRQTCGHAESTSVTDPVGLSFVGTECFDGCPCDCLERQFGEQEIQLSTQARRTDVENSL